MEAGLGKGCHGEPALRQGGAHGAEPTHASEELPFRLGGAWCPHMLSSGGYVGDEMGGQQTAAVQRQLDLDMLLLALVAQLPACSRDPGCRELGGRLPRGRPCTQLASVTEAGSLGDMTASSLGSAPEKPDRSYHVDLDG